MKVPKNSRKVKGVSVAKVTNLCIGWLKFLLVVCVVVVGLCRGWWFEGLLVVCVVVGSLSGGLCGSWWSEW